MDNEKLERINELAKKSRETQLSDAELTEQKQLRDEYIASYRQSLRSQLDNITIVEPNGRRTKIVPKKK